MQWKDKTAVKLTMLAVKNNFNPSLIKIDPSDLSKLFNERYIIRDGKRLLVIKELEDESIEDIVELRHQEYRELFRGLFPGSMGNLQEVKRKLVRWLSEHPEVSFDELLELASKWIEYKGSPYCGQANYFLYKVVNKNGTNYETSRAEIMLEDMEEETSFTQTI